LSRPDHATLLDAVARFLATEAQPRSTDRAVSFRLAIAANLASVIAAELRSADARHAAALARLRALLPAAGDATREALDAALVRELRDGAPSAERLAAIRGHLRQTLRETLAVTNPRFDPADEIE
jgi:hypothetical protein